MRTILLAATALAMLCGSAFAQNSQSNSGSNATVNTASGSQSQSIASPKVTVTGNTIGNGASSSTSGAKSTSSSRSSSRSAAVGNTTNVTVGYTGYAGVDGSGNSGAATATGADPSSTGSTGYTGYSGGTGYSGSYTVRNTPEVIPPSVVGGNPCSVGASGGVALPGFGVALGGTWADKACERRQQAALLFNMGENRVAFELMCQDDNVRNAMRLAGRPCAADIPLAPTAQAAAPATLGAIAPGTAPPVAKPAAQPRPAWCAQAAPTTEASKAYVAQECGG